MPECSQCHAPLPEDAPLGVCPACLLEGGTRKPVESEEVELGFLDGASRSETLGDFDRYAVLEVLGQGATGIVLKAEDPSLQRTVAIKVLHPVLSTSAVSRKRFLREARAAAAVSHDHVVTIHAVSEWKGLPYLVMECIAGKTLADRIRSDGPLELKEILRIGRQIAAGLGAAHAQGLVHRDIKPSNVLLENSVERVKLTDFGLARAGDEAGVTLTGFVAGTPEYMSPEQAKGEEVDARSDLYGFGAVAYAMATGRPPVRGNSVASILKEVAEGEPKALAGGDGNVPEWLDEMVLRLLAKTPAERPGTAAEVEEWFAERLARVQSGEGEPAEAGGGSGGVRLQSWVAGAAAVVVVVVVVVLGTLVVLLWPESTGPGPRHGTISPVPPRNPDPGPGSGAQPLDPNEIYTPELFWQILEQARDDAPAVGTREAHPIDDLLQLKPEVVFVGVATSGDPNAPQLDDLDDLPLVKELPAGAEVTFFLFIKAGNPKVQRMVRNRQEKSGHPRAWILLLNAAKALKMLPPKIGEQECDVWALVTPKDHASPSRPPE